MLKVDQAFVWKGESLAGGMGQAIKLKNGIRFGKRKKKKEEEMGKMFF